MNVQKIIIHHAGADDGPGLQWGAIRKWHVDNNKWDDIGYHAGCELVGDHYEVLMGRPWNKNGAHTIGENDRALGFCFVGNFNEMSTPDTQIDAGVRLIHEWLWFYNLTEKNIYRHSQFNNTDCPGASFDWGYLMWSVKNKR